MQKKLLQNSTLVYDKKFLTEVGIEGLCAMLSHFSHVQFFVTLWTTVAGQAPLTMGFSRQEYWSRLPCHPPGDLPNSGIKPISPVSPALAGEFFTNSATWEAST